MQYAKNKKAYHEYEILETLEAGLVLEGHEAKSIRNGGANLKGAYVTFHKGEPMITGMHVRRYKYAGSLEHYDPDHSRKLLLNAKEIRYLSGKSQEKGLTIVPLSVYNKGRHIMVEIGIGRGKKRHDKRRVLKDRETKRAAERAIKESIR